MKKSNYALITGGSTGLGKELALQCAARKFNLILVALPGSHAQTLAEEIHMEYDVDVQVFEFDLTDHECMRRNVDEIVEKYNITFLINNAGIGGTIGISESSPEAMDRIIQVNIRSMVMLTRIMLPHLLQQPKSYLMNIASMAAFTPIAFKTVYPASKAFVSSFSLGLREELHDSPLSVSVVYPGPIMTNSNVSRRIWEQGLKAQIGLLPSSTIARIAVRNTLAGRAIIIPGMWNRVNQRLMSVLPISTKLRIVSSAVRKELRLAS